MDVSRHKSLVFLILLFCMPLIWLSAHAGEYRFAQDMSNTNWNMQGDKEQCLLSQEISDFGKALFNKKAGEYDSFSIESWQGLIANSKGLLSAFRAPWQGQPVPKPLAEVVLNEGKQLFWLDPVNTQLALANLEAGKFLQLEYNLRNNQHDKIIVEVSPVNFRDGFKQYVKCIRGLLPYRYADIKNTNIYYASDSADLSAAAKEKLDKIIHYFKAGAKIKKIQITGYTDNRGRRLYNQRLATDRADSPTQYLIEAGIPENVIAMQADIERAVGEEDHGRFRRAEIKLMKE